MLFIGIYLMALFEQDEDNYLALTFEATSALATAGLSSGILPTLSVASKGVLITLMFIGRVGVITLGNVMLYRAHNKQKTERCKDLVV